jgi:hypothetical protein
MDPDVLLLGRGAARGEDDRPPLRRFADARSELRSSRPDISGVNSIVAPPCAASPIALPGRPRGRGSIGIRLEQCDLVTRQAVRRACHRARARPVPCTRRYAGCR